MRLIDVDRLKFVLEKNFGHTGGASVLEQLIDEQPTIKPSTNCSEIPNSSDTISRQAVIDGKIVIQRTNGVEIYYDEAVPVGYLKNLPTVQPKRKKGKWIYNSPVTMKCDQCGLVIKDWDWHRFKICPNCGADMRDEKDERTD